MSVGNVLTDRAEHVEELKSETDERILGIRSKWDVNHDRGVVGIGVLLGGFKDDHNSRKPHHKDHIDRDELMRMRPVFFEAIKIGYFRAEVETDTSSEEAHLIAEDLEEVFQLCRNPDDLDRIAEAVEFGAAMNFYEQLEKGDE